MTWLTTNMLPLLAESEENHALFLRKRRLVETGDLVDAPGKRAYKCGNCEQEIFRYPSQVVGRVFCKICRRANPISDFWSKVDKTCSKDGCWLWTGKTEDGYGNVNVMGFRRAHRLAYFLIKGPIPPDKILLHKCPGKHNRLCVNPDHLQPGTKLENVLDSISQGTNRFYPGSSNPNSVLNEAAVVDIRRSPLSASELALKWGVTAGTIRDVRSRSWRHVLHDSEYNPFFINL